MWGQEKPETEKAETAQPLTEAVREARIEAAERSGVVVDLRDADVARLELLNEALDPLFKDIPDDVELFDRGLSKGDVPKLWIDVVAHGIELAEKIGLSTDQLRAVKDLKMREEAEAKPLGAEIVAVERELDQAFATHTIDRAKLRALTGKLGELQGRLRAIHLAAHLDTNALFNTQQIARYNELRGYAASSAPPGHNPRPSHNR